MFASFQFSFLALVALIPICSSNGKVQQSAAKTLLEETRICLQKLGEGLQCDYRRLRQLDYLAIHEEKLTGPFASDTKRLKAELQVMRDKVGANENAIQFWETSVQLCEQFLEEDRKPISFYCDQSTLLNKFMQKDLLLDVKCRKYAELYVTRNELITRKLIRSIATRNCNELWTSVAYEPDEFFATLRVGRDAMSSCPSDSLVFKRSQNTLDAEEDLIRCAALQRSKRRRRPKRKF